MVRISLAAAFCACLLGGCAVTAKPQFIGTARMLPNLTIEQKLISPDEGGMGEALIVMRPGDPGYRETMEWVGGLSPGEMKAVPAWPG